MSEAVALSPVSLSSAGAQGGGARVHHVVVLGWGGLGWGGGVGTGSQLALNRSGKALKSHACCRGPLVCGITGARLSLELEPLVHSGAPAVGMPG